MGGASEQGQHLVAWENKDGIMYVPNAEHSPDVHNFHHAASVPDYVKKELLQRIRDYMDKNS